MVDLTKAFDSISREGLWWIKEKFGCPAMFIRMVSQFHDGTLARVLDDGDSSDAFPVTNRVKQGCVLAPTQFSAMLSDGFCDDEETNIKIKYIGLIAGSSNCGGYRPRTRLNRTLCAVSCS
ncbi:hypothetical protein NDU88_003810 [Pleurodeles waltl]|uniref:Reverse transcriptase domain-containing protein n=1 Tax=Pleurodeles waltl TaxID=8319 RepID=A0AAV7TQ36_PLEWA|nr:hypothetical protein NDU88_003810 [Pleurodeles waltl]